MLSKNQFVNFICSYKAFEEAFDRIEKALYGASKYSNLFEADWYEAVGEMLSSFLKSHFTEEGCDLVNWWLFEQVAKVIYEKFDILDLFADDEEIEISVETIDELWDYMEKRDDIYFLQ